MENVLKYGKPTRLPPADILDLIHNKLNKTQVVRGAIFDLLTSQVRVGVTSHNHLGETNRVHLQGAWHVHQPGGRRGCQVVRGAIFDLLTSQVGE